MRKLIILPKLAITGMQKNSVIYLPYLLTYAFSTAIYFIFEAILDNKLLKTIPYSDYMLVLMMVGKVLLALILIPFLFYTNSFLIKRRNKELALYNILGLEKRHIASMMLVESIGIFLVSCCVGMLFGGVFSKLIFAILMKLCALPTKTAFTVSIHSMVNTLALMGIITIINLFVNLLHVFRSSPTELMQSQKTGEKEPKRLWLPTMIGIVCLGIGYVIAIRAKMDSMIFLYFFLAVFLVCVGTYFLFTSGSIAFLRFLKKNNKFYYKSKNYVTIAGMIYRMKKNAAGLSNICIFGTMIIITLICTTVLIFGQDGAIRFLCPYDVLYKFSDSEKTDIDEFQQTAEKLAQKHQLKIEDKKELDYYKLNMIEDDKKLTLNENTFYADNQHDVLLITLDDYKHLVTPESGVPEQLGKDDVLIFSTGADFARKEITIEENTYQIVKEVNLIGIANKEPRNLNRGYYFLIMKDKNAVQQLIDDLYGVNGAVLTKTIRFQLQGSEENKEKYMQDMELCKSMPGYLAEDDIIDWSKSTRSMNGGLVFLGIFFGIIFSTFLLLIMYYKQITEGLEDKSSYDIMQKVGMSGEDVKGTIQRQILLVFFIPLIGAIIHSIVGLHMVFYLLSALNIFNVLLMVKCAGATMVGFALLYTVSYLMTARTYYRIVK